MKKIELGNSGLMVPNVSLGCMRIESRSKQEATNVIETALDLGINFFDHADIYGNELGGAEKYFGELFKASGVKREEIILQSKVGIREHYNNGPLMSNTMIFQKEHLLNSVDDILQRLQTDYLDVLFIASK